MPAYQKCSTLNELINLWLVFAGDNETWREVIKHRLNCATCQENNKLWTTKHTLEALPGENDPKPESELTGINAAYAAVQDGWKRTIAPMPELGMNSRAT